MPSADVGAATSPVLKVWQRRVFAATWLSYFGFYFCRKPFYIVKSDLGAALHFDATTLGDIGSAYLLAYTAGQFAVGALGSRLGPRVMLLVGMAVSIAANVGFGLSNSAATFIVLMALNGACQATGWSCGVGTMANWFPPLGRGRVMGLWATNFQVGGLAANALAALVLGHLGFRYAFFAGSVVLLVVWAFFLFHQRDRPEDVGLPPVGEAGGESVAGGGTGWTREAMVNVFLVGVFYFFVKFIRYSLWSWAPFFLKRNFGLESDQAGYLSTAFDAAGIPGVVVTGYLSERLFKGLAAPGRRAAVSLVMIVAMTAACLLLYTAGGVSVGVFTVCLVAVGFTLYGPDALMSGAGAMDLGSKRGALLAAGVINGMGSIGSVLQELVIGRAYDAQQGALGPIFLMLLASSALAAVTLTVVLVRSRRSAVA